MGKPFSMPESQLRVLILPSWYPTIEKPGHGIFIQRHVTEIAKKCNVTVIYFELNDLFTYGNSPVSTIRKVVHANLEEITVHLRMGKSSISKLTALIRMWWCYFYLVGLGKIGSFDIIHLHVPYNTGVLLAPFLLLSRKPLVITDHWSGYFKEDSRYFRLNFLSKVLLGKLFDKAKAVTLISKALANAVGSIFNVMDKVSIIYNAIASVDTPRPVPKASEVRKEFLFIGNFNDFEKNISGILEAFAAALKIRQDIYLTLVGDGNDFEAMKRKAADLNIGSSNIQFKGFVEPSQLNALYEQSICYIMNSNFETFSISTVDALMRGVPVIATRCKGPEEYVNSSNGVLVDTRNNKQLYEALLFMADHFRNYSPQTVHLTVKDMFGMDIGEKYSEIYKRIRSV